MAQLHTRNLTFLSGITIFALVVLNLVQDANCEVSRDSSDFYSSVALKQLRTIIKDEELNLEYMKTDQYLLAWLRKNKFNVEQTAERIRSALKWRKEQNVDNLHKEDFSIFLKQYPFDIDGVDKDGRPVWFFQMGKWDLRRIVVSGQQDKFDRYRIYLFELVAKKMRERNEKNPDTTKHGYLGIIDLAGFNLRQHGCIRCLQGNIQFELETDNSYPEGPYKAVMINAPTIFEAFWNTVKGIIPTNLPYEIGIYDFDQRKWKEALLKDVDRDQLPTQYGGTRKTNLL